MFFFFIFISTIFIIKTINNNKNNVFKNITKNLDLNFSRIAYLKRFISWNHKKNPLGLGYVSKIKPEV